jgi:hypothetical protein
MTQEVNVMKRCVLPFASLLVFILGLSTAPVASAAPGPWWADDFANPSLEGAPALSRQDATIGLDWGTGAPVADIPADGFSVRWTQPLYFDASTYRSTVTTDGGVRLWVDSHLLIDVWHAFHGTRAATIGLTAGVHRVRMEYFDDGGGAVARLGWARVTAGGAEPRPVAAPVSPAVARIAAELDRTWQAGMPDRPRGLQPR